MEITDRRLLNGTVTTGADVMVRVDLANFYPARGRIVLNLTANRTLVAQRTVAVGVDSRRTVTVRAEFDRPRRYRLRLNGVAVGVVTVRPAPTASPTATPGRPSGTPSTTVAPTPAPTSSDRGPSVDEAATPGATRAGTGTVTPVSGPGEPTGTEAVVAAGMSLALLYGVGIAVYVLRDRSSGGFD